MKETTKSWVWLDAKIEESLIDNSKLRLQAMKYAKTKTNSFRLQAMLIEAYIEGNKNK